MKNIIAAIVIAASGILSYSAPASAYVCYSDYQYRTYGSQCNK